MGAWVSTDISPGSIRQGQSLKFEFVSNKTLDIFKAKPDCESCTTVKEYDKENNSLEVVYKAGPFPEQFIAQGKSYYDSRKSITVTYSNGQVEVLYFTIRVFK